MKVYSDIAQYIPIKMKKNDVDRFKTKGHEPNRSWSVVKMAG